MKSMLFVWGSILFVSLLTSCASSPDAGDAGAASGKMEEESPKQSEEERYIWKPVKEVFQYVDGSVDKTIEHEYDSAGRILRSFETDQRDEIVYDRRYKYENGLLVSQEMFDREQLISLTLYQINSRGQVTEELKQGPTGLVQSIVRYDYEGDNLQKTVAADGEGIPRLISRFSYTNGIATQVEYLLPDGREEARFLREIQNNRIAREETILPGGTVESAREFTYEGENLAMTTYFTGSAKTKSVRFEYDADGNPIRETWSNRTGRDYQIIERDWMRFEEEAEGGGS